MPVHGVVMLVVLATHKLGRLPFPGISQRASAWFLALAVGISAIVIASKYVRKLRSQHFYAIGGSEDFASNRARLLAAVAFWMIFVLSLGIPGTIIVLAW